jgi:hypothetical protein
MPSGSGFLLIGAAAWLVAVVLLVAFLIGARDPWWVETLEEIDGLPEAGPEEESPRDRPSQDDQP